MSTMDSSLWPEWFKDLVDREWTAELERREKSSVHPFMKGSHNSMFNTPGGDIRYSFKIVQPPDIDARVLILMRYTVTDEEDGRLRIHGREVFTVDGWEDNPAGSYIPLHRLPQITGVDMYYRNQLLEMLDEFEQHIRAAIKADTGMEVLCH